MSLNLFLGKKAGLCLKSQNKTHILISTFFFAYTSIQDQFDAQNTT